MTRWRGYQVDVRQSRKCVHQRVAREKWGVPQARENVDGGPPAWNEVPGGVCVRPPFAAHVEVEERAGFPRHLAQVTAPAGAGLPGGEDAAKRRDNAGRYNGIEEGQFHEIALGLGGREKRVGRQSAIREPRLGKVVIVRHHQFLNSTDCLVDEPAQLGGAGIVALGAAVVLRGSDSATQKENAQGTDQLLQEPIATDRLRRRSVSFSIPGLCKLHFRFALHISYTSMFVLATAPTAARYRRILRSI